MKQKLIVLEAADGLGKSTQTNLLKLKFDAHQIQQPNGNGVLGFLRKEVKEDVSYFPLERQLLHTISHINDAYTEFSDKSKKVFIMDRCHLSAYVYGKLEGISEKRLCLLMDIHRSVYETVLKDFDIFIIHLIRYTKYVLEETDEYEKMLCFWDKIRDLYNQYFSEITLFNSEEQYLTVEVGNLSEGEVSSEITNFIKGSV